MLNKFISFLGLIIFLVEIIILIFIKKIIISLTKTHKTKYYLIILLVLLGIIAYISLVIYLTKKGKITL